MEQAGGGLLEVAAANGLVLVLFLRSLRNRKEVAIDNRIPFVSCYKGYKEKSCYN